MSQCDFCHKDYKFIVMVMEDMCRSKDGQADMFKPHHVCMKCVFAEGSKEWRKENFREGTELFLDKSSGMAAMD